MDTAIRLKPTIKSKEQTEDKEEQTGGSRSRQKIKLYPNSNYLKNDYRLFCKE
jgi:hypothetical protein